MTGIEPVASSLPRTRSTPELQKQNQRVNVNASGSELRGGRNAYLLCVPRSHLALLPEAGRKLAKSITLSKVFSKESFFPMKPLF